MTKPLPAGTVNLTVNVSRDERLLLGRISNERGQSLSELIRDALAGHVSTLSQDSGERLRRIRLGAPERTIIAVVALVWIAAILLAIARAHSEPIVAGESPADAVEVRR